MRLRARTLSHRNSADPLHDPAPSPAGKAKAVRMPNGCWAWGGNLDDYGHVQDGKLTLAHRWTWEMLHGVIPEDHHIHHECGNPGCVNPEHLRCVTPFEHIRIHMGLDGLAPQEALVKRVLDSRRDS